MIGASAAWSIAGIFTGIVMAIVGIVSCAVIYSNLPFEYGAKRKILWVVVPSSIIVSLLLATSGAILIVRSSWSLNRENCRRVAANYSTAYRYDRLIGCYLRDNTGRFVPQDSYITARIEKEM